MNEVLISKMQFYIEPEVSWTSWLNKACLSGNDLTELGSFLKSKLKGGTFIDVPCGYEYKAENELSVFEIAKELGVYGFIEVDKYEEALGERLNNSNRVVDEVRVSTHQADILEFLFKKELNQDSTNRAFYISGLQPDEEFCKEPSNQSDVAVPYLHALYEELARVSKVGDLVILNEANALVLGIDENIYPDIHPSVALPTLGFKCQRTCQYNKVQVFEKV
ncbi:hypothetical protein HN512_00930 [Candidatus Peregrinibacteria bacterium]|nr:hypothetical protein [Candidatus Peregrinibacteria bacterium]MBT3598382.1 hypothetical protein [Candidatus Peregrinibacteria bacterium]MBT4367419.1 hypothetical protein [Candidatus Peregrinibacteria bacterium]MBT4585689.1 hypothetical protein [Candidatus Peregrinibacteria bacterium]MBT6730419.1 hypothetical protein [Candidatus Peregrinibacteria bacterium]